MTPNRHSVLALDLSLTATGVAQWPLGCDRTTWAIKTSAKDPMGERLDLICHEIGQVLTGGTHAIIEDYALHGPGDKGKTGMVHGVVRRDLWCEDVPLIVVSPASLKLWATGKGNSGKPAMLAEAIKRLGFDGHDDNEVDALWLWTLGCELLGDPVVDLPQTHRRALEKIDATPWGIER